MTSSPRPGAPTARWWWRAPSPRRLALLAGLLYLPFVGLGYGTDVDIENLRRSGASLLEGDYAYSRPPGSFPYEAIVGVLDRAGGPTLVNLASAMAAVGLLVALAHLVASDFGDRAARIAVLVVATQPWFWVSATSLGDYPFALGLLLAGILAARAGHPVVAGVLFATAIAFRSSTLVLVGAHFLAVGIGPTEAGRPGARAHWRPIVTTVVVTTAVTVAWFIPSWLSVDRSTQFLVNEFDTSGWGVVLGRWAIKNVAFLGVFAALVLLVRLPVLIDAVRTGWSRSSVRFAVFAAIAGELVYFRFPWKLVHLLPVLVALAILVASGSRTSNRFVAMLVGAQLLLALVSVTIASPDVPDAATTGRLDIGLVAGVAVNELDCRLDPPFEGGWPVVGTPEAEQAAYDVFACRARSWRPED